jgi:hypothetical protein
VGVMSSPQRTLFIPSVWFIWGPKKKQQRPVLVELFVFKPLVPWLQGLEEFHTYITIIA